MKFTMTPVLVALAAFVQAAAAAQTPAQLAVQARQRFIQDAKTTLFSVRTCREDLCVDTTSREAADFLRHQSASGLVVRLLPEAAPDQPIVGLVRVPVAALHRSNAFSSEIVSEAVMGTPVRLLEKNGWWHVQTPEGYLGWVHSLQVTPLTAAAYAQYLEKRRAVVSDLAAPVYARADRRAVVTELPNGALVTRTGVVDPRGLEAVRLPDGRTGWMETARLQDFEAAQRRTKQRLKTPQALRERVADQALRLLGRSYRWAGTSPWGLDCSGLVKAAWRMAGLEGPRDADQMARLKGHLPAEITTFLKGDLLFFGRRGVSHVGISLGGTRFVHSLGDVHVGDLDPKSPFYEPGVSPTFLFAVRPAFTPSCLTALVDVPLYNGRSFEPLVCPRPKSVEAGR